MQTNTMFQHNCICILCHKVTMKSRIWVSYWPKFKEGKDSEGGLHLMVMHMTVTLIKAPCRQLLPPRPIQTFETCTLWAVQQSLLKSQPQTKIIFNCRAFQSKSPLLPAERQLHCRITDSEPQPTYIASVVDQAACYKDEWELEA